jgi:hypothetical protein
MNPISISNTPSPTITNLQVSTWTRPRHIASNTNKESTMSDPVAHDSADLRHGENKQPPSNQHYAHESISQVNDAVPSVESAPANPLKQTRDLVNSLIKSMKRPADGKCFSCLCKDGVLRILYFLPAPLDEPTPIAVYDAKPLSPELLKAYLDYRMDWNQEVEDCFRGVDGTSVPQE